jgi:predicted PurR-regulated permease PerM
MNHDPQKGESMNKAVAGTVLGVGMAAIAITGAGAASADPISDSVKSVTDSVNHTVDGVTGSFNKTVDGVTGSFNKTASTVVDGVNGNNFVSNLGSGGNILTVSKNLHGAVQVWTKVGNGR